MKLVGSMIRMAVVDVTRMETAHFDEKCKEVKLLNVVLAPKEETEAPLAKLLTWMDKRSPESNLLGVENWEMDRCGVPKSFRVQYYQDKDEYWSAVHPRDWESTIDWISMKWQRKKFFRK